MYAIQKQDETLVTKDGEVLTFIYEPEAKAEVEKFNFLHDVTAKVVEFQYIVRTDK